MSAARSKRRSRKARSRGHSSRAVQAAPPVRLSAAAARSAAPGTDRPQGIFGELPISELAILVGIIGLIVGWLERNNAALVAGAAACGVGVLEVTAREHFAGFRSHTTLLAAVPALVTVTLVAVLAGVPRDRVLVLLPGVPVFLLCAAFLRRSFEVARHRRRIGAGA